MSGLTGGCAGGAVRHAVWRQADFALRCRCGHCQPITGSGHVSLPLVPAQTEAITGAAHCCTQGADRGDRKHDGFCPNCASPVFSRSVGYAEPLHRRAASLDELRQFDPQAIPYSACCQPCDHARPQAVRR